MTNSVTVYGKPQCQQCNMTENYLKRAGIEYDKVDITEDAAAYAYVTELGYLQAPVVTYGEDHWSGFIPDRLANIAA